MLLRRLLAIMFALALIAAPLGMPAMAAAPAAASHHGQMAGQGHCDDQPAPADHGKAADKSCCAAMCVAVALPSSAAELPAYHASLERPASDLIRHGFLGEIATPPPRRS